MATTTPSQRKTKAWSIRAHLFALVLAVAIPLIALLSYDLYHDAERNAQQVKASSLTLAQITASDTKHFLKVTAELMQRIAQRPRVLAVDPKHCDPIFADLHDLNPTFANIGVINPSGFVICSAVAQPAGKLTSVAQAEWFQRAMREDQLVLGKPFVGPITGRWVSVLALPLHDKHGAIKGLLALPIDLVNFTPLARDAELPKGSQIGIVDSAGTIIARSGEPEKWVGKNVRGTPIIDLMIARKNGQAESVGVDHVTRLFGFASIPGTDWVAGAGIPRKALFSAISGYVLRNLAIGLAMVLTVAVLAYLFSRRIVRPIRAISDTAKSIAQGKLDTRVAVDGPIEIADVADQFNAMLDIREEAVERISYLAQYDVLTNLPNRNLFRDRLEQAMMRAQRNETLVALMFIDLDRFKEINDTLGHPVGDQVLQKVAERLKHFLRDVDTIARLGGDEFTIVLEGVHDVPQIATAAQKVRDALVQPLLVDDREIFVSASIGISIYPFDVEEIDALLKNADIAMYQAKQDGGDAYHFFEAEMNAHTFEHLELEGRLRRALARNQFTLHYQPQVSIANGRIIGAEALLRWHDEELGMIAPARFIPLAETTGLIVPIGEWVLHTACAQNKAWQDAGCAPIPIAVNLSPRQFRQANLLEKITQTLEQTGLHPNYLELEITESTIMHQAEKTIGLLEQLHAMGVRLSVDDFGTGYSSLSYLKRFPVHKLKIDQSFVRDINLDPDDAAIVTAVIAMARSLNVLTIAEGVETEEQLAFLDALKCAEYQGYYFAKPMPADEFCALLRRNQSELPGI